MARFYRKLQERHVWPILEVKQAEALQILAFVVVTYAATDQLISLNQSLQLPTSTAWPYIAAGLVGWSALKIVRQDGDGIRKKHGRLRKQMSCQINRLISPRPVQEAGEPVFIIVATPDRPPTLSERLTGLVTGFLCMIGAKKRELSKNRLTGAEFVSLRFGNRE